MRIIRDERHINTFSFIGKYATLAGLMILLAGLIISFAKPEWMWPLLVSLTVGIGMSAVGGFFAERYAGPLAHHDALAKALKGLDDDYTLFQYVLPAPHVLVDPGGCTALVVKAQGGEVSYDEEGERWKHRQRGKAFRQLAGQEALGTPDLEARRRAEKLESWLSDRLPEVEVPVRAAIVFVNPNVALDADDSPIPAFYDKKVKGWLRGPGRLKTLPTEVRDQLTAALEADT